MTTYFVKRVTEENYLVTVPNKAAIDDAITEGKAVGLSVNVDRTEVKSTTIKPSNVEQQMRRREVLSSLVEPKEEKLKGDISRRYDHKLWVLPNQSSNNPIQLDIVGTNFHGIELLPRFVHIKTSRYTTRSGDPRSSITFYCADELPTKPGACGDYYDLDSNEKHKVRKGKVVKTSKYNLPK